MIAITQLHHHKDKENLPGVVDLGKVRVDSVQATLEPRFPYVEQRLGEDLKVLDGEFGGCLFSK